MTIETILTAIALTSLLTAIFTLGAILGMRLYKTLVKRCSDRYSGFVKNLLLHYLTEQELSVNAVRRLHRTIINERRKRLVVEVLQFLTDNFEGRVLNKVRYIYRSMHLYTSSLKKLKSRNSLTVVAGMRELASMDSTEHLNEVLKFCESNNPTVRAEAYIASIQLSDDPLFFMDSVKGLTKWEEMNVMHHLKRRPVDSIPSAAKWLNSPDKVVVKFCLKIIAEFGQYDAMGAIHNLLHSTDESIVMAALKTLKKLRSLESSEPITDLIYHHSKPIIKMRAFNTLLQTGTNTDILPVAQSFLNSPIESLKKTATESLIKIIQNDPDLPQPELAPFLMSA